MAVLMLIRADFNDEVTAMHELGEPIRCQSRSSRNDCHANDSSSLDTNAEFLILSKVASTTN